MLRLAAVIFTTVCAYRSVLPRIDVPRICWLDTPLNWVVFGRAAATVAEVSWALQMGLVLRRLGAALHRTDYIPLSRRRAAAAAGCAVIAMACTAECFSWTNLITESNVFAVVEQGLWCILFLTTGLGMAFLCRSWPARPAAYWVFIVLAIAMGLEQGFESLGLYLPRFLEQQAAGAHYQDFTTGLRRLASCAQVTQDMATWKNDAPWMTGYFSVGVWTSIWLSIATFPATAAATTASAAAMKHKRIDDETVEV